ncbi:MAG: biotin--[acetyl-CoA-carboxylase] ligase [Pseudomonadales bacterium]|nr:biotin--[acetyl-CoA-carboxylase] ligase [Pseudomonadales bacterium]MBO6597486.1 biotin--[acetyl-CoA-carboxylase] ligase [Pseudomonadales bacterium]MBO6824220.1 biotin--[acetyl-CoA-carboxylase] ligase [Pseudomonadales bacterium]
MIKSTHPEFERMVSGEAVPDSDLLMGFLEEAGVPHERSASAVRLSGDLELLDPKRILDAAGNEPLSLEIHRVIGSTNDTVMQRLSDSGCHELLCTAEMQTAGKGRRGRSWVSPFGRNIYVTYGRFLQRELSELGGLSIVVGMQAVDTLRDFGLEGVGLKWPNDILLAGGKLGGILVELKPQEKRGIGIAAGMGINFMLSAQDVGQIDQAWSVIGERAVVSRNQFLGAFTAKLTSALRLFNAEGFEPFVEIWHRYDAYPGEIVRILRGQSEFEGVNAGIDGEGNLLLQTDEGLQSHNAGEVSMRTARQ